MKLKLEPISGILTRCIFSLKRGKYPKSYCWAGVGGPCNLVSALGLNPSFFLFFVGLFNLGSVGTGAGTWTKKNNAQAFIILYKLYDRDHPGLIRY